MSGTRVEALTRLKIQGRVQRDLFQVAEDRMVLQQARYWSSSCSGAFRTQGAQYASTRKRLRANFADLTRSLVQATAVFVTAAMSYILVFGLVG